ncbi:DUF721 domain-containing protein [Accumulibacter sp.]|uniref:DUF721 domain-containing protein n=1 Tax=Accumulibacter sp. TaxID=2053492 RepID=UPI0026021CC8|nr:DUF721 domain-containing protein [Accumulibacter sp.]
MPDRLQHYLQASDGAGKVLEHAGRLIRIAGLYAEIAPRHLSGASQVANLKSGVVVIHADNGAVATKLRQMAPTLVEELRKRGIECHALRVKVQARTAFAVPRPPLLKPLSARAGEDLSTLCETLPASPLRQALETLLARAAREE